MPFDDNWGETLTEKRWDEKGTKIFGTSNRSKWAFRCPICKRKQTQDEFKKYKHKGAKPGSFSMECIGRYTGGKKGPHKCDWAAYGLFSGPMNVVDDEGEKIPFFYL